MRLHQRKAVRGNAAGGRHGLRAVPAGALNAATALFVAVIAMRATGSVPGEPLAAHVSNFGFTGAGMLLLARSSWLRGFTQRWLLGQSVLFAAVNLVMELAVDVGDIRLGTMVFADFNTADPLDAPFGLAAVAAVLGLAAATARPVEHSSGPQKAVHAAGETFDAVRERTGAGEDAPTAALAVRQSEQEIRAVRPQGG